MSGTSLPVPLEWGNMLIWLWLEVLALGALILWTTNAAHIIVALYLKNSQVIRLSNKRTIVDWFPMNEDMRQVPNIPKVVLTFVRIGVTVAVAFSALGIEPAEQFIASQPTTDMVVRTDANFTGRSFNRGEPDLTQDFAVSACEDVSTISVFKFKAFVSNQSFSCNDGEIVGEKTSLVEVIWHKDTVRQIVSGRNLPVNIRLGDRSRVAEERSNNTHVELESSDGAPAFMFLRRTTLSNQTFGQCEGDREYLVVGNSPSADIVNQNVAAALVICEPGSAVLLRNTDNMIFLSDLGANQQLTLARQVAESLVSIVRDQSGRVFEGEKRNVTILKSGYDVLVLCLSLGNIVLLIVSFVVKRLVTKDNAVDVFSSFSMYKMGSLFTNGDNRFSTSADEDIKLRGKLFGDSLVVEPVY